MELTADLVRGLLDYDSHTGLFRWLQRPNRKFPAGGIAGSATTRGYTRISYHGRQYLAHRLAWLHFYGEWPPRDIDHVNGNPSDNRLANLRLASHRENCANRRGVVPGQLKGVALEKRTGRWRARIKTAGQEISLGYFGTQEEAHAAYKVAASTIFGEFARAA